MTVTVVEFSGRAGSGKCRPDPEVARLVEVWLARHRDRLPVGAVAARLGVSVRTVHRDFRVAARLVRSDVSFYLAVVEAS